jgi:hypothetical protein
MKIGIRDAPQIVKIPGEHANVPPQQYFRLMAVKRDESGTVSTDVAR